MALSCWNLYFDVVISLRAVCITDALKILWHSAGLLPAKAVLVMLQVSLEGLGSIVLLMMVVGIWWSRAWRKGCGICCGMSAAGMCVDHLARLLARRSIPYVAELNVGRVIVNEYGHVRSWGGIASIVLVMGSSSSSGRTGYVECSWICTASSPSKDVGSPVVCIAARWLVRIC